MKHTKLLLVLALATASFIGCQKEFSTDLDTTLPTELTFTPNISTTITGRVVDEMNKPVMGAFIKTGTTNVVTNINGEFTISNVNVYDQAAFVQVTKTGYFTGSRTFVARSNSSHYIEVKLIPKSNNGTIVSATGGTVTLANGASVTLPASAVVVASSNAAYTGNVNVSMAWIDPTGADLAREMPGDLRGINLSNTEMGLQSFGMMAVELTGDVGEKLQVAPGKKATMQFPLPASIAGSAPAEIPLWSFDETKGLWKQEGTATKTGSSYTAEVTHFSFWNCDAQFPIVNFKATIKDQNGIPLRHKLVRIKRSANNNTTYGYTDSAGVVSGKVPSNEALVLEVVANYSCANVIHTENIGPFSASATITVTVNSVAAQATTITGSAIDCNGAPVTNGYADVILNFQTHRAPITNGSFTLNVYTCNSNQVGSLVVTDVTSSQQSTPTSITLTQGTVAAGSISACGTTITQFINFTLNGTAYSLVPPGDSLTARLNNQVPVSTMVSGFSMNTSNDKSISFQFQGTAIGTAPVTNLYIGVPGTFGSMPQGTSTPATITEYGPAGGYVAGSFSANVSDSTSGVLPVTVNFRVKRN